MEKPELRPDQIEDLASMIRNERYMLLSDPGAGKTGPVVVYMNYLWTRKNYRSAFVMPKSLLRKNRAEILLFTNFAPEDVVIVDGTPAERAKQMSSDAKVFLMGPKRYTDDWETLRKFHPDLKAAIFDEYHLCGFKTPTNKSSTSLFESMRHIPVFVPMSGTLISGRLDSCYTAIHIIEPRYYLTHGNFMAQHAVYDEWGNVITWRNHEKIGRILKTHATRRTFESIFGNQDPIIQNELVGMPEWQREKYSEFEEKAILELEDKFIEGVNGGVFAMRCRQIMQTPEVFGIVPKGQKTGKDEALMIHLEDHIRMQTPVILYAAFQLEHERLVDLCDEMGMSCGMINGNVPSAKRGKLDEEFRAGNIQVMICSPETAGIGYNWGHVDHIIYTSLDYANVNFTQSVRRAIRGKRKQALRVTVLEYEDSIDQQIFRIVNAKSGHLNKVDESYKTLTLGEEAEIKLDTPTQTSL